MYRNFLTFALISSLFLSCSPGSKANPNKFSAREADWKNGAVVYQIFPDRFAPPLNRAAQEKYYVSPKTLRDWSEFPKHRELNTEVNIWGHEMDFWGGNLKSIQGKLDYLQNLGVDVVYLNPIFQSMTNHKYDTQDYFKIDEGFGTEQDLKDLTNDLHDRDMKIILDGVFNHMGRHSPYFQEAMKDPKSKYRNHFVFTDQNEMGYKGWLGISNLPELNMDDKAVQKMVFDGRDSVVQHYMRKTDIDGWRLDVAHEFGYDLNKKITNSVHSVKKDAAVILETWNFPSKWLEVSDGVMNFHAGGLIFALLKGDMPPRQALDSWKQMVKQSKFDGLLKSWIILDNHDTERLTNQLPAQWQRRMAQILQFTLPGAPCLYYGTELGMRGGHDPANRGPMEWSLLNDKNKTYSFYKDLLKIRKEERALRVGDFVPLKTVNLFGFMRMTDSVEDTVLVFANPGSRSIKEMIALPDSNLQNWKELKGLFGEKDVLVKAGILEITVPARSILAFKVRTEATPNGHDVYRRIP